MKVFSECIICEKKTNEVIKEMKPFVYVNINNINEKNIFNILLKKKRKIIYMTANVEKMPKKMYYVQELNII